MPDSWRPDISGVVVRDEDGSITFTVLDSSKVVFSEEFADFVTAAILSDVPVYFQKLGPPGHLLSFYRMNERLLPLIQARDLQGLFAGFKPVLNSTGHLWKLDGLTMRTELLDRSGDAEAS